MKIAREIVRDHESSIYVAPADGFFERLAIEEVAAELKAFAFGEGRNQFATLRRLAFIEYAETQIRDRRIEGEAKQQDLQDRRNNQSHGQAPVAANLVELFADEYSQPLPESRNI
jgi:hypothetical protein